MKKKKKYENDDRHLRALHRIDAQHITLEHHREPFIRFASAVGNNFTRRRRIIYSSGAHMYSTILYA